jgi:hypothetical protein
VTGHNLAAVSVSRIRDVRQTNAANGPIAWQPAVELAISATSSRTPPPAWPLRWRVAVAGHQNLSVDDYNDCATTVTVMNVATTSTQARVDFYGQDDAFINGQSAVLDPDSVLTLATLGGLAGSGGGMPLGFDVLVTTGNFEGGFAKVYADDPRILVAAFMHCRRDRTGGGGQTDAIRGIVNIPAFPVGATARYFQAGMPISPAPGLATPEPPQTPR